MQKAETVSELLEGPKFIADRNVGRLAPWLRVLRYDTLFLDPIEDQELVRIGHYPVCQRIYGRGTHWEQTRHVLQGLTPGDPPLAPPFVAAVPNGKKV